MAWYQQWAPYVPVAERRRRAMRKMNALRKKGVDIQPIAIDGRKIAKTFWGEAWCDHLESFSDFENRLPRGRTYVRNGSVCHLAMAKGKIEAKVSGSQIYNLRVRIKTLPTKKWRDVKRRCAGQIGSLLELLEGNLSDHVMEVVTDRKAGLFPLPGEISFDCDCPDWAVMCKHVAAVLYGAGARLDEKPELLFTLRGVKHEELIDTDADAAVAAATTSGKSKRLAPGDLSDVFGIDIDPGSSEEAPKGTSGKKAKTKRRPAKKSTAKKARKKTAKKRPSKKPAKKTAGVKKSAGRTAKKKTAKKAAKKKSPKPAKKKSAKAAKKTTAKKAKKREAKKRRRAK
jgi:uncharacterized Zn finger protein